MIGITLRTASEAGPFWRWVDRGSACEEAPSIRALGYPPHLTLARYADLPPGILREALKPLRIEKPVSLIFDRVGLFDVDPLVLWLSPRSDRRLTDLHARLHETVGPALCDPHYRPGQWTPHLSIATTVPVERRSEAFALAAESFESFSLVFDAAEIVSWPPVRVLGTVPLAG